MGLFSSIASAIGGVFGGPVGAAAAGGGATLLGGLLQNNSAKAQADRQMEFQEEMSNTSYQRGMEDMRKAGLNPILAAKVGGASTPSGSAAPVENVIGPAVSTAREVGMAALQSRNLQEQNKYLQAQQYQAVTAGVLNDQQAARSAVETDILMKQSSARAAKAAADEAQDNVRERFIRGGEQMLDKVKRIINPEGLKSHYRPSGFTGNSAKSLKIDTWPDGVLKPPKL